MYCCDKKCFEAPRCQVDGIACERCQSLSFCRCLCKTHMDKQEFCCNNKCFVSPRCQVDGIACERCQSYCLDVYAKHIWINRSFVAITNVSLLERRLRITITITICVACT